MNELLNGIPLASTEHLTGHNVYNNKVEEIIQLIDRRNINMSNNQAYTKLTRFINYLENLIRTNPNLNLGEIADLINYPV